MTDITDDAVNLAQKEVAALLRILKIIKGVKPERRAGLIRSLAVFYEIDKEAGG